jgi:hypothetical protein
MKDWRKRLMKGRLDKRRLGKGRYEKKGRLTIMG